jgi:hypothetical protein
VLTATYSDAGSDCGLVVYQIRPGGVLDSQWTVQNDMQVGAEQARRIK